jgi:hypothetical protein
LHGNNKDGNIIIINIVDNNTSGGVCLIDDVLIVHISCDDGKWQQHSFPIVIMITTHLIKASVLRMQWSQWSPPWYSYVAVVLSTD